MFPVSRGVSLAVVDCLVEMRAFFLFVFGSEPCYTSGGVEGWRRLLYPGFLVPQRWNFSTSETCGLVFGVWCFPFF